MFGRIRVTAPRRRLRAVVAAFLFLILVAGAAASAPSTITTRSFARGGFQGSGPAAMTSMTLPARVARVAVVPGSHEAWALGFSSAAMQGWDRESPAGQVVFLHYTPARGWKLIGPPTDSNGVPKQPNIAALSLAASGEGWAVGEDGVLVHHAPGGGWVVTTQRPSAATLLSVSLVTSPSGVAGYAAGDNGTVLRLSRGTWSLDPAANAVSSIMGELAGVSAVSADEAWAVTSSSKEQLYVWHRTDQWHRVTVGQAMFDAPPAPTQGKGTSIKAARGAAVAGTSYGAWVTGSLLPIDVSHPIEDAQLGDSSRPFAVWIPRSESNAVSYCPMQYGVNPQGGSDVTQGSVDVERICDKPMPIGAFDLASVSAVPSSDGAAGGEAFAGGLGLYHFKNGGWWREPDPVGYIVSTAFSTASEGWIASSGNTFGATGLAYSSTTIVGHWSRRRVTQAMAPWGIPTAEILEAVARGPSGRVIAVGQSQASVVQAPDGAFEMARIATGETLHAVAWPGKTAWAVGNQGTIARFDGLGWSFDPASLELTRQPLFGLAFRSPRDGVAVGGGGTILRYDGEQWRRDRQNERLTEEPLYAVTTTATGYAAVGGDGTVLFERDGRWRKDSSARHALGASEESPALYAVVSTAGNRIATGGQRSALIGGTENHLAPFPAPIEGTVLALAALSNSSSLLASISEEEQKYLGAEIAATSSALMAFDGSSWRDVQTNHRRTLFATMEPGSVADPILSMAPDSSGSAWGVGGVVPNTLTPNASIYSTPTSSLYRIDLRGNPAQPDSEGRPQLPVGGVSFAFFGETGCGRGLCSVPVGSGIRADVIPLEIQREINALRGPQGIRFAIFGGNMRQTGMTEELAEFKGYLKGFRVPAFATIGDADLLVPSIDGAPAAANQRAQQVSPDANRFWLEAFADAPAPWGTVGARQQGIVPVEDQQPATIGIARTHFAFDFAEGGKSKLRVVIIDTSRRQVSGSQGQNPPDEQMNWLGSVLESARSAGIPAVVLTNQPTLRPVNGVDAPNWPANDIANFYRTLVLNGVPGAISAGIRDNSVYGFSVDAPGGQAVSAPFFVSGGAGAPLAGAENPESSTSFHGWLLVTIDPSRTIGPFRAPIMTVRTIPVLSSLAMSSAEGRTTTAGRTMTISGLGRALGGGAASPAQSRVAYVTFPQTTTCSPVSNACFRPGPLRPDFRFWSEDPAIADFVALGPTGINRNASGDFIRDGQSGVLCTFKAGDTFVNLQAGFRRARVPIHVSPGTGPCQEKAAPVVSPEKRESQPEPQRPAKRPFFRPQVPPHQPEAIAIFPAPVAPVVAAAPPGAPGVGRKEEHEVQWEEEGHGEQRHAFTALAHRRDRHEQGMAQAWSMLGGVVLLSFMGAAVTAAARREKRLWQIRPSRACAAGQSARRLVDRRPP